MGRGKARRGAYQAAEPTGSPCPPFPCPIRPVGSTIEKVVTPFSLPTSNYIGTIRNMQPMESTSEREAETAPATAAEPPLPRRFERYTLLKRLARGGMGEVLLASSGGIE